jgi:hypothetical protein
MPDMRCTASASERFGVEKRDIAAAVRTAFNRRKESPFPVPDMPTAWRIFVDFSELVFVPSGVVAAAGSVDMDILSLTRLVRSF